MTAPTPDTTSQISIFDVDFSSSYLNVLLQGNKWGGALGSAATVYYSFPTSRSDEYWSQDFINGYGTLTDFSDGTPDYESLSPLSTNQQNGITLALNAWANVANLDFIKVNETPSAVGDIRFGFTNDGAMAPNIYAYTYSVDQDWFPYSDIFPYTRAGDIWFNANQPDSTGYDFSTGAMGYFVGLHEIGHALGLDHSFAEEKGDIGLPTKIDYIQYTVMSYSDRPGSNFDGFNEYYPTTPMLYDILAIQHLYGANNSYNAGDTVYEFSSSQHYYETIWDGGGNDTIKYTSPTGGIINLEAGAFSRLGQTFKVGTNNATVQQDNIAIAFNVVIENAIGGSGNDKITGNIADNHLQGGTGNDTLDGAAGNDILDGEDGVDKLIGGKGDDTYIVDLIKTGKSAASYKVALQDTMTEAANAGNDTVQLRGIINDSDNTSTITLGANLENLKASATNSTKLNLTGNALDNTLTGNDADNILDGGKGIDTLIGGAGNDTYILDFKVSAGNIVFDDSITEHNGTTQGIDVVKLRGTATLATAIDISLNRWTNIETLDVSLTGKTKLNLTGNNADNTLIGNTAANVLTGGAGDDTLNGGAGADTMSGGDGDDIYIVDNIADSITEEVNEGTDLIRANINYSLALANNVENLELTGNAAINGTGNDGANIITGNAAKNILDGKSGIDALRGGKGNDTYIVDNEDDEIIENFNEGTDVVKASSNFSLSDNVENLTLTDGSANGGSAALEGTGNALANTITGNAGDNTLDGGAGVDKLIGGAGNDNYIVDLQVKDRYSGKTFIGSYLALEDTIIEAKNAGNDTLVLRGNAPGGYSITLVDNVENLDAQSVIRVDGPSSAGINLYGNALDNRIWGNNDGNAISGGAGNDTLFGGDGEDTLDGGEGINTMAGGKGSDTYIIRNSSDVIYELAGDSGIDRIFTFVSINLDLFPSIEYAEVYYGAQNVVISRSTGNVYSGSDKNDQLIGDNGNDRFLSSAGNDTLTGGLGADTFIWSLADKGSNGKPAIDKITDFNSAEDKLDLRDLLVGESNGNILNYLDITTSTIAGVTNTEIRISNHGGFINGNYSASAENQHITLTGVNLLNGTNEASLLANLISQNKLMIDA